MPSGCLLIKTDAIQVQGKAWLESQPVAGPTTIADCNLIRSGVRRLVLAVLINKACQRYNCKQKQCLTVIQRESNVIYPSIHSKSGCLQDSQKSDNKEVFITAGVCKTVTAFLSGTHYIVSHVVYSYFIPNLCRQRVCMSNFVSFTNSVQFTFK